MDTTRADTLSKHRNTIQRLSLLKSFKPLLERLHSHADCHNRKRHYDHSVSLLLLYFFNPTFTGLRSIQHASTLRHTQDKLGIKHTSPGSLSEASHVFDPQLLTPLINELAHDAHRLPFQDRFHDLDMTLVAVDGTLIKTLPKMLLWMDEDHRAAKMHNDMFVLSGLGYPGGTHRTYRTTVVQRTKATIATEGTVSPLSSQGRGTSSFFNGIPSADSPLLFPAPSQKNYSLIYTS